MARISPIAHALSIGYQKTLDTFREVRSELLNQTAILGTVEPNPPAFVIQATEQRVTVSMKEIVRTVNQALKVQSRYLDVAKVRWLDIQPEVADSIKLLDGFCDQEDKVISDLI